MTNKDRVAFFEALVTVNRADRYSGHYELRVDGLSVKMNDNGHLIGFHVSNSNGFRINEQLAAIIDYDFLMPLLKDELKRLKDVENILKGVTTDDDS